MDALNRLLTNIKSRVSLMVGRGVLKAVADDAAVQVCQAALLDGELKSGIERAQNYGLTSVPPVGSVATVLFVGGDRSNGIVISAESRKFRLKGLQAGEVALYTDEGDEIRLKRGHEIAVKTSKFVINAAEIDLNGAVKVAQTLEVAGNITGKGEVADKTGNLTAIRSTYNGHTHTGNAGAPTSPPLEPMEG